jgi:hypothetical protein
MKHFLRSNLEGDNFVSADNLTPDSSHPLSGPLTPNSPQSTKNQTPISIENVTQQNEEGLRYLMVCFFRCVPSLTF